MKFKSLVLILTIFMMCGCTAEINLEIDDTNINENVAITVYQNALYSKDLLKTAFRNYIPIYADDFIVDTIPDEPITGIKYYNKTTTDLGDGYLFNYNYNFEIDEYKEAKTIKNAFRNYNVYVNNHNKTISIKTDDEGIIYFNNYPELEEVTINIKTNYKVENHNADKVKNNVYSWVFTKDSKKSITMLIDSKEIENTSALEKFNNSILLPVGIISIAILLIIGFITLKNKLNNKI